MGKQINARRAAVLACAFGCAGLLGTESLSGQGWTDEEKASLLEYLDASAQDFAATVEGLTDAQWDFQESEDRWSIRQVTEHLALSEEFIGGLIVNIAESEPADMHRDGRDNVDVMIRDGLKDRSQRFQAPQEVTPSGHWESGSAMLEAFDVMRARVSTLVRDGNVDLRAYMAPHPAFGPIDGHQWVLLLTSHVWRHLDQIEQVKADADYPSSY